MLKGVIKIADGPRSFLDAIEKINMDSTFKELEKRRRVAFMNSWPKRIEEVETIFMRELKGAKFSS